ncbi:MAG TPA: hypothetical protein VFH31_02110 [Pyrinomonadaceae bacterium]|nr:hypothetical protein [Pyrinomonadaceae bacterium]
MIRKRKLFAALVYCAMLFTSAAVVFGQDKRPLIERRGERTEQAPMPPGADVVFIGSEMGFSFDGKVVKGAPYSGQAVTETTQILGDGNRIVNKSTASVYRDKEGRTRREQTVAAIGPFGGEMPQMISINDPVAGVSYVLEPSSHVARKLNAMQFEYKLSTKGTKVINRDKRESLPDGSAEPTLQVGMVANAPGPRLTVALPDIQDESGKQESLGKQSIEGVEAEGTRTTKTIAAGEIGNERAIEIVSERWYSPELQTVVMTKHSDPRFGETVYRLTNINRTEPDASLFRIPSDYRIEEMPLPPMPMRIRVPNEQ